MDRATTTMPQKSDMPKLTDTRRCPRTRDGRLRPRGVLPADEAAFLRARRIRAPRDPSALITGGPGALAHAEPVAVRPV